MARSTFDLDIRAMLAAQDLLALLDLPTPKRKRLLNNVTKRVRSLSRQRIRNQQNLDGTPFEARKDTSKGKKKMEAGLGRLLEVTRLSGTEAELGWRNTLTRWVASQQHNGVSERRTAAQMRQWNKVPPGTAATEKQAKPAPSGFQDPSGRQKDPDPPNDVVGGPLQGAAGLSWRAA
ncbi:Prophage PssSM-01, virion morphoproteinsis protein [Pseudomonas amygdali pv. ulmi]|uniref:Prophage PssSM-01, virion morphoproteinsis protein n=1 Tax=Pseudomonas amygdali pv. ulmi TaxID=251720 RepID=A0A3M4SFK0_PSEA0|nr:Prophage PssSM-01, virion morphoproteinsis protein [Pseudomonas amygdali pv. ulmi]